MINQYNIEPSHEFGLGRFNLKQTIETLIDPLTFFLSIVVTSFVVEGRLSLVALTTGIIAFSIAYPGRLRLRASLLRSMADIALNWMIITAVLLFLGFATQSYNLIPKQLIYAWLIVGPTVQFGAHLLFRACVSFTQADSLNVVIIGLNKHGLELARNINSCPYNNLKIKGFFDDRDSERLPRQNQIPLLGKTSDAVEYCKKHNVHSVYLTLPMTTQPRIISILDELQDTTASIYFVPDLFVTDLIQGHIQQIGKMPIVSVRDTPFSGFNALTKRLSDILLSALILLLIAPLMLAIALAVKLSSQGPIIFKQRRYGLDGQEILVYKFRTMTVCEDGNTIIQAKANDSRITPLGAILRKTSLDELPQFINVIEGKMSIVGPRPHAVAHNEMYRKLIKGYMIRHKVRPGITGWAQVNGLRGETKEIEKMQERVKYDIDYLRNWSLLLDLKIILMTVLLIPKDPFAR